MIPEREHQFFTTPLGQCALVFSKTRLVHLFLPATRKEIPAPKYDTVFSSRPGTSDLAKRVIKVIQAYFEGRPGCIGKPPWPAWDDLFMDNLTPLQRDVLGAVSEICPGSVQSYGQIARAVGRPKAARFVGNTMSINPFPILIPCHRVVRSDGSLGHYGGGTEMKSYLLRLEGAVGNG